MVARSGIRHPMMVWQSRGADLFWTGGTVMCGETLEGIVRSGNLLAADGHFGAGLVIGPIPFQFGLGGGSGDGFFWPGEFAAIRTPPPPGAPAAVQAWDTSLPKGVGQEKKEMCRKINGRKNREESLTDRGRGIFARDSH